MKVLGLDIGTTSIGWAFTIEDDAPQSTKIVDMGVRIVPLTTDENDAYIKGQSVTTTKDRTLKRTARRNKDRYKLRKKALREILLKWEAMPDEDLFSLTSLELYGLRDRALREKLSMKELGRIWFHLNQKRGYKSSRISINEDESESDYLEKISTRRLKLVARNLTIGQFFYQELLKDPLTRIKQEVFPRDCYEEEFDKIWDFQKQFHPEVLNEDNRSRIKDEIIYYQRKLKSQKHLVSHCSLEGLLQYNYTPKVAPKSSPLFQVCKIWEMLNNIVIKDKKGTVQAPITLEQKRDLFNHLDLNFKISNTELLKKLGYIPTRNYSVNFEFGSGDDNAIQGNVTKAKILEALQHIGEVPENLIAFDPMLELDSQPFYRLWHLLYSIDDAETVIVKLQDNFGLSDIQAKALSKIDMRKAGFCNKSVKAMKKILPYLMEGKKYSDAKLSAGFPSESETKEQRDAREIEDIMKPIKKNELRNPVVEKILNQMVNLVNAIIADPALGRPDEIRVELARELKQNAKRRGKATKENNERKRVNDNIVKKLQEEYQITRVSKKLIDKYKLYMETDGISLYSGKKFELAHVLNSEQVDVDHIIPRSRLFDDSLNNKVLTERHINEQKTNQTAFDYIQTLGENAMREYVERVAANTKISDAKRKYLLMSATMVPDDFISRQLRETQYIVKEATNRLKEVCTKVFTTSGSITDLLRHEWGLDDLIQDLNRSRYQNVDAVDVEKNSKGAELVRLKDWTKRDDHRHHALDALVIALTKQGYISKLNKLNQDFSSYEELKTARYNFPVPAKDIRTQAEKSLSNVLISFKNGKKVGTITTDRKTGKKDVTPRGQLHNESVYGLVKRYVKVPLNTRFSDVAAIVNPETKKRVEERLAEFENDPKNAFKALDKNPIWVNQAKGKQLTHVTVFQEEFVIRYKLDGTFTEKVIDSIVDTHIREAVRLHLRANGGDPKKAFTDLEANPVYADRNKKIRIKSVRCFTGMSNLQPLHLASQGQTMPYALSGKLDKSKPVDYVSLSNNHHLAVYETPEGKRIDSMVSFWEAVSRKKANLPVIQKDRNDGSRFLFSLQVNEMVVLNMDQEELQTAIRGGAYSLISANLYRVQKMSKKSDGAIDVWFRHHLETKLDDSPLAKSLGKFVNIRTINKLECIKVKINNLGKVEMIS